MPSHLQELMEDGEHYGWLAVRAYHVAWFQHLEQGWAMSGDEAIKLKLCHALMWHPVMLATKDIATPSQPAKQQQPNTTHRRRGSVFSELAKPGDKNMHWF